jgi:predicted extracellular nuclease
MTRSLALAVIIGFLIVPGSAVATGSTSVAISEVYGGGGNSSAPYTNDFIELRNLGSAPVSLSGWSVQYASATGSSWSVTALPAVTLPPGRFFLVQEASGGAAGSALPTPDATGAIAMASSAGKVALVASATALTGTCPGGLVDLAGYGATASCFEGTAAAPAPSNTLSDQRAAHGLTDSDDNAADFQTAAPEPQNSTVPTAVGLRSFTARRSGPVVLLRWRTASEAGAAGFEVYRGQVRVSGRPIPAAGSPAGSAYLLRDVRPARSPRYRLVEVGMSVFRPRYASHRSRWCTGAR